MKNVNISAFLLERYRLGEVTSEEKQKVEEALASDSNLIKTLADLDRADNDFHNKFPFPQAIKDRTIVNRTSADRTIADRTNTISRRPRKISPIKNRTIAWGICAAAMLTAIALPMFILRNTANTDFGDRMKGASSSSTGSSIELNVYAREDFSGDGIKLEDNSWISHGSTIQIVYSVFGASNNEKYGVIFSIDGRSSVTMHYPYTPWQSTSLVLGRAVPLDEAFTLDDAPDYEIFFFVAGDNPIDIRKILENAKQLALLIKGYPEEALKLGTTAFKDYELNVFTLIKE